MIIIEKMANKDKCCKKNVKDNVCLQVVTKYFIPCHLQITANITKKHLFSPYNPQK